MLIQLPGGTAIDALGDTIAAEDNGEIATHTLVALSRLIERWRDKDNLRALVATYTDQIQALENVIWDVIVGRLPDYAAGFQLDALGRIVGEDRNGLADAAYRVRIKARIKINSSFGRASDVIGVLQLIDPARFKLIEQIEAAFEIDYTELVANAAVMAQIPEIVRETRAVAVGALVTFVVDTDRAMIMGSVADSTIGTGQHGMGSVEDTAAGGLMGHAALA